MVPATLTDSRKRCFAEAHFKLVAQDKANNQFTPVAVFALAAGHGCGKDIGGVRRVLLPIDVVVVHAADHERVREGGRHRIDALAGADYCGWSRAGDFVEHLERNLDVVLLVAAKRAADGVKQEALGLVNRVLG